MKTLLRLAFASLALAAALPAYAADTATAPTPEPRPESRRGQPRLRAAAQRRGIERKILARKLDLTAAQREQLKSKRASTAAALKAIRQDASLAPEQKRAKAQETFRTARSELRAVLTPEQQTKLEALQKRARRVAHRRTAL